MDDGRWPLAWLLSLQPEPPWSTMFRRKETMQLRPFGRLADARWIAAATGYIRDMDRLNSVRRAAASQTGVEQPPGGAPPGKGKKGEGKGKDSPNPSA